MFVIRIRLITFVAFLLSFTLQVSQAADSCIKREPTCSFSSGKDKYVLVKDFICDTQTDGGRWTIFQRRVNQDTSFTRNWDEYKNGFGDPTLCQDYWLGNERLHTMTSLGDYELRIDMTYEGKEYFAKYSRFEVGSEENKYRLTVGGFTGNVTDDDFMRHNDMKFSTPESDNDIHPERNCAQEYQAGWWYSGCHFTNLNGQFKNTVPSFGVVWFSITTDYSTLSSVEMKMRPILNDVF